MISQSQRVQLGSVTNCDIYMEVGENLGDKEKKQDTYTCMRVQRSNNLINRIQTISKQ